MLADACKNRRKWKTEHRQAAWTASKMLMLDININIEQAH